MPANTPKAALQQWAETNHVSPADFGRKMNYSYNHAYQLLRGEAEVKIEMLGRFVVAYGIEAAQPIAVAFSEQTDMDGAIVLPSTTSAYRKPRKMRKSKSPKAINTIPGLHKGLNQLSFVEPT